MTLAAAQIVDAIAARISGLALAGDRIYTDRAWPIPETSLPAGRVLAVDEDVEPTTVHGPALEQHVLQVELHALVRAVEAVDDAMHALAAEWLTAIFATTAVPADALFAIKTKLQVTLRRIDRHMTKEGEAAVGLALITLRVVFRTRANAPETLV
jgi:hypothetical protein